MNDSDPDQTVVTDKPGPLHFEVKPRPVGELPLGVIIALPLLLLPAGGWLVESQLMNLAQCSFKVLLGVPCMGCGATRATLNLLHGNLLEGLYFSPLVAVAYLVVGVWGAVSLFLYVTGRTIEIHSARWLTWTTRIGLIALPFINWGYLVAMDI